MKDCPDAFRLKGGDQEEHQENCENPILSNPNSKSNSLGSMGVEGGQMGALARIGGLATSSHQSISLQFAY